MRAKVQLFFSQIEDDAAELLPEVARRWPLEFGGEEWCTMVCLVGAHMLRNPAGRQRLDNAQRRVLARMVPEYARKVPSDELDTLLMHVTSDGFRAQTMIRNLRRAVTLLGSMHWTLLEFPDGGLATSDQPVVIVPLIPPGETVHARPMIDLAMPECLEIRFALGPRHAMLLTWHDAPDTEAIVQADDAVAAHLNRSVIRQADRQWFHHPARRPTTVTPPFLERTPCSPVSGALVPRYGFHAAVASNRRARVAAILQKPDDDTDPSAIKVVIRQPVAA